MPAIYRNGTRYGNAPTSYPASNVAYDPTTSGLSATNAQNAIDELRGLDPQIKTASGSIASFTDGGDDIPVSEYECEIVAQQASGTPTPSSPLPISGFSQSDISVLGKNLLKPTLASPTTHNGVTYTVNSDGTIIANGKAEGGNSLCSINSILSGDLYDVLIPLNNIVCIGSGCPSVSGCRISFARMNGSSFYDDIGSGVSFTVSNLTPSTNAYIRIQVDEGTTVNNVIFKPMLRQATITDATYEPYTGNTYLVEFGQTIYGGRLIYKNGEWSIEATHVSFTVIWGDGTNSTDLGNNVRRLFTPPQPIKYPPTDANSQKCDKAPYLANYSQDSCHFYCSTTYLNLFLPEGTSNSEEIMVVAELATPVIIPITSSTRVKTISGVNNIFSNTGDNSVKYFTDGSDTIVELVEQVSYTKEQTDEEINEVRGTYVTGTLTAGSTSITLSDASITTTSTIDIYVSVFGIQPTNASVATGSITLTFLAQASDISVKVRVS